MLISLEEDWEMDTNAGILFRGELSTSEKNGKCETSRGDKPIMYILISRIILWAVTIQ